jgi:hypothetical protein
VLIGIMEDEVDGAVTALPSGDTEALARIAALKCAGEVIAKIAAAAEVVLRRYVAIEQKPGRKRAASET